MWSLNLRVLVNLPKQVPKATKFSLATLEACFMMFSPMYLVSFSKKIFVSSSVSGLILSLVEVNQVHRGEHQAAAGQGRRGRP